MVTQKLEMLSLNKYNVIKLKLLGQNTVKWLFSNIIYRKDIGRK